MNFSLESGTEAVFLSKAILLYDTRGQFSGQSTAFASLHDVANTGSKDKPDIQIMPGTPLTQDAVMSLMGSLSERYIANLEILPETVLSYSPSHLVWWMPAKPRSVFFNNRELGKRSGVVPQPPLLFIVANRRWYVFALSENSRPTKDTVLCHAPYFNVYDNGNICIGTAAIPEKVTVDAIPVWENAFFGSEFTHVNGNVKRIGHPNGEYAFWKAMLDGQFTEFPMDLLVTTTETLPSIMQLVGRELGRG